MSGVVFEERMKYCCLRFTDEAEGLCWEDMERAAEHVIQCVQRSNLNDVIVEATALKSLTESVDACLLRLWNALPAESRHLCLVTQSPSIRDALASSGLLEHWSVAPDYESAQQMLVQESAGQTTSSSAAGRESSDPHVPIVIEEHSRYLVLHFDECMSEFAWSDQENAITAAERQLRASGEKSLMVDLSDMNYINSGVVAGLVRLWKATQAREGQFSIVSPNEIVTSVLEASGLAKVWSISDDRVEAAYALGVSHTAIIERRERALLVAVSLPCALLAVLMIVPMFLQRETPWGINAQLAGVLLSAAALATGSIGVFREEGLRRKLAGTSVVVSLLVLSTLWFRENPISFRKSYPDYQFSRESDDSTRDPKPSDQGDTDSTDAPDVASPSADDTLSEEDTG